MVSSKLLVGFQRTKEMIGEFWLGQMIRKHIQSLVHLGCVWKGHIRHQNGEWKTWSIRCLIVPHIFSKIKVKENKKNLQVFYSHFTQFCLNWQTYPAQLWWDDMSFFSLVVCKNLYNGDLRIKPVAPRHSFTSPHRIKKVKENKKIGNAVILVFSRFNLMMMD